MTETPSASIPAALEAAVGRLRAASVDVCERSAESLNLATLSSQNALQRERFREAHVALHRGAGPFKAVFDRVLHERVGQEWCPRGAPAPEQASTWDTLRLVDDHEVDLQVHAERFGMTIGHGCEWELRELDGYVRSLAHQDGAGTEAARRNPLRPENLGHAVMHAIEALHADSELTKILASELARSWSASLPKIYAGIIAEMRAGGLVPLAMGLRSADSRTAHGPAGAAGSPASSQRSAPGQPIGPASVQASDVGGQVGHGKHAAGRAHAPQGWVGGRGCSERTVGGGGVPAHGPSPVGSAALLGHVDPALMLLLRRLAREGDRGTAAATDVTLAQKPREIATTISGEEQDPADSPLQNLIHAHRQELLSAARGSMDHMIIDVVGSLFEQILSDPKVAPHIARQIGRLQLPVLRAAMGDPSFFASRRHPVRRLINRIASLGAAFDDLDSTAGRALVSEVQALVQDIVDGDFDQIALYESKLKALEIFATEQGRREIEGEGRSASLFADREAELRDHQRCARQLRAELQDLPAPDFVRDFIADVWSQVLLRTLRTHGPDSEVSRRLRQAGRDLFMSVQAKGEAALRQGFLAQLPKLMQELNQGMELIGWPESARKTFFGLLLPAHAQSLRGEGLSTLDFNLRARQIELVLQRAMSVAQEGTAAANTSEPLPLETGHAPLFTPHEAQAVGLLTEEAIDWNGKDDIELDAEQPVVQADLSIQGMPEPEAPEPTHGRSLAEHVQIGFAYQMHLEGRWQKVRLTHVSPGRTFFVFSRGERHRQVVSLTHRMLLKLCESGRLRAFEHAYLLERATARARRQLAALRPTLTVA